MGCHMEGFKKTPRTTRLFREIAKYGVHVVPAS